MITVDQLLSFLVHWFYLMGLRNIFFMLRGSHLYFFFLGKYSYANTPHLYQKQKQTQHAKLIGFVCLPMLQPKIDQLSKGPKNDPNFSDLFVPL